MTRWREPRFRGGQAFDAVERPISAAAESWVQTDSFMDALAFTFKLQRRAAREVESAASAWLRVWGMPTRGDLARVTNQVASLERELREVRRAVEGR